MSALVAGVGNIFHGDDAFGVEVANRLAACPPPGDVHVADFGIRGLHLAYELLNGYDTLILVDATQRGGAPGTLYVLDIDPDAAPEPDAAGPGALMNGHDLTPETVFALLRSLGGRVDTVRVVGCEPDRVDDHIGLSAPVATAVDEAVRVVWDLATANQPEGQT
ncbi:hydrogenase maturation protease [Nocardiopsis rhodophaea]|uniref:hydrogenase maturation protease n=1 Tax=Nocardiopsis rhodophaea TaxID=280238 RepID=UPI0031DE055B